MRHKSSTFEYKEERDSDLLRAYKEQISKKDTFSLRTIFKRVVKMPSARFWVSEERAAIVIGRMFKGDKLEKMNYMKRRMFNEIFRRVKELKVSQPLTPIHKLTRMVVKQPAPEFYLTPSSAKVMVYRIKKKAFEKRMKRLRHMFNMSNN